jgi:hypothetical protein
MVGSVLKRLSKFLLILALAGSIGMHWVFLQSVAWAGMVVAYSQDDGVSAALAKTFDGEHPCCLCKQIAKDQQAEKKADLKLKLSKLEFPLAPDAFLFRAPDFFWEVSAGNEFAVLRNDCPPAPPPRSLLC